MRAVHHRGQWYVRAMCSGRWNFGAIFEFWIWILDLNFQNSNMAPHQQCVVDNLICVCHDTFMCVCAISFHVCVCVCELMCVGSFHMCARGREVGGWGRVPFSRNLMSPTPRRKWYLTTGRRFHSIVLDPIPQSLPVHFFGSRPQPPTSRQEFARANWKERECIYQLWPRLLTTLPPVRAHTHSLSHTRTLMQQVRSPRPINGRRSHAAPILQPYPRNAASTPSTTLRNYHHRSSSIYTCHSRLNHECVPGSLSNATLGAQ